MHHLYSSHRSQPALFLFYAYIYPYTSAQNTAVSLYYSIGIYTYVFLLEHEPKYKYVVIFPVFITIYDRMFPA